jgi:hypothetical protein
MLVERHQGALWADSNPGEGPTFISASTKNPETNHDPGSQKDRDDFAILAVAGKPP